MAKIEAQSGARQAISAVIGSAYLCTYGCLAARRLAMALVALLSKNLMHRNDDGRSVLFSLDFADFLASEGVCTTLSILEIRVIWL